MSKRLIFIFLSVFCLTGCIEETSPSYTPAPEIRSASQYTPMEAEQPMGDNLILKISGASFD